MFICLIFSINVYQLSVHELERGLRRPIGRDLDLGRLPPDAIPRSVLQNIQAEREREYQAAKDSIIGRLILLNALILITGGALSYYLARRTLQPIEAARDAQTQFTADASHELRTPIAVMRTENEVALMDSKLTLAKAKAQFKSNIEELDRLSSLSEGLLHLARGDSLAVTFKEINISDVLQTAVDRVLPLAEKQNILISSKSNLSVLVQGNETSLAEVFTIILENAVKYSDAKTEIEVSLMRTGHEAIVTVKDSGMGIFKEDLPHIFDRFYRSDTSRTGSNGFGLGLAIAKDIITQHNGHISVSSKPAKGSIFTVTLPAIK
jgi:two-component system, OmpR family, sensor histidine kinase CiaH